MTEKTKKDRKIAKTPHTPIAEVTQKAIREADPEQGSNTNDRSEIRQQNTQKQGHPK
jgi:hypothetical protein